MKVVLVFLLAACFALGGALYATAAPSAPSVEKRVRLLEEKLDITVSDLVKLRCEVRSARNAPCDSS